MTKTLGTYGEGLLLVAFAASLVVAGPVTAVIAFFLVATVVALVCFGPERVGFGFLALAFLTAPSYKGLSIRLGTSPTDLCLVLALVLLLPRIVSGRNRFAAPYVLGVVVILVTGTVASAVSTSPLVSFVVLIQWVVCMAVLPMSLASLHMSPVVVNRLAWAFVGGHLLSTLYALAAGPVGDGGRYLGLTQHPNAFGQSGMLAFALLLHLFWTTRQRWIVLGAMAVCLGSVYLSGSRAATLTVAALVMLVPIVERSALAGYLIAALGAGAALAVQQFAGMGAVGGSIGRLTGAGSASGSDAQRTQGLTEGLHRFGQHPLLGNGMLDLFWIHNNYVEVAVAVGIFGLAAYLMILWSLVRGLLSGSHLRRLCYPVVGYGVFGATVPSLTDRSIWMALVLSFVVFRGFMNPPEIASVPTPDLTRLRTPAAR